LVAQALWRMYALLYFSDVEDVDGRVMSSIAFLGVLVNLALAAVLGEHHHHGIGQDGHCHSHDHDHTSHDHSHSNDNKSKSDSVTSVVADESSTLINKDEKVESYVENHDHNEHSHEHEHSHDHASSASPFLEVLHGDKAAPHSISDEKSNSHHEHHEDEHDYEQHPISRSDENLNLRAAYLHVLGDLCMSFAVLVAGLLIWKHPKWQLADPLCTLLFSIIVARSTVLPFQQSMSILMNETPPHIDYQSVHSKLSAIYGVSNAHDLHIWSISQGVYCLSVHLNVNISVTSLESVLTMANDLCKKEFGIDKLTVQVSPISSSRVPYEHSDSCITCE